MNNTNQTYGDTATSYTQPNTYTGATAAWQEQHQQQTQQQATPYANGMYNNMNNGMYNNVNNGVYAPYQKKNEKIAFAVISLILGILSILCCCWIGVLDFIIAIPAIVLAIITLTKKYAGKGMAIAGLICGAVGIVMTIIYLIFFLTSGASAGAEDILNEFIDGYNSGYYY